MYMRVEMMLPQVPQAVSTPLGHYITWKKYYRIIFILKDVTEFMQINSDDGGFFSQDIPIMFSQDTPLPKL